jgi:flagellar motility protein MotE (MotC chaperone)
MNRPSPSSCSRARPWRAAALASALALSPAAAQDGIKLKPAERPTTGEVERYCGALAPGASEARAAYQLRRLADLEAQVREAAEKLEAQELAAREWVTKRDEMMKAAMDDVVAIYGKMDPETAAPKLAAMDDMIAAAVLAKLNPRAASAILSAMDTDKAARLSTLLAGVANADKS